MSTFQAEFLVPEVAESCQKGAKLRQKRANHGVLQGQRYFLVTYKLFDWRGSFLT